MTPTRPILTIGHSCHSWERFTALLDGAGVETIADIRSAPRSRFWPQFNKDAMAAALAARGVEYMFLGSELGGRPQSQALYSDGVADYDKMAASPEFRLGLERLTETAARRSVAAMCSEADPVECHRCLLVGRALAEQGVDVRHILASGEVVTHAEVEERLLSLENLAEEDLLASPRRARLAEAYRARSRKPAIALPSLNNRKIAARKSVARHRIIGLDSAT
jgi:uncharacterized protein (DUF488 family)